MGWKSGWTLDGAKPLAGTPDVEALRQAARAADAKADGRKGVEDLVKAWTTVLRASPEDYEALWNLSSAYTLMATGYSRTIGEKGELYRKALQHAERAMFLDQAFRQAVEGGAATWDAIEVLPVARVQAIGWWIAAMTGMYRDCLSGVVQETNRKWVARADRVVSHLQALDGTYEGGLATFLRAADAAALSSRAGGDPATAASLFENLVTTSPDWLRNRWGRARFLAAGQKDEASLKSDLQWVVAQDLRTAPGSHGWNAWYQRDAADLLAHPVCGY